MKFILIYVGKLLGTKRNYMVAEVEFREGEDPHQDDGNEEHDEEDLLEQTNVPEVTS